MAVRTDIYREVQKGLARQGLYEIPMRITSEAEVLQCARMLFANVYSDFRGQYLFITRNRWRFEGAELRHATMLEF